MTASAPKPSGIKPLAEILGESPPVVQVVDVGAAMLDSPDRYAGLVARGGAMVTGFEPDDEQRKRIEQAARPGYRVLPQALGRGGPAILHVTQFPGCSSLYEPDPAVIDMFTGIGAGDIEGNFRVVSQRRIETHRLDDVPGCPAPDLLKIDVQGAELDVLAGAVHVLNSVSVIECEVEFLPLYKGQPLFGDVQVYLARLGFQLHKFLDISGRTFRPLLFRQNPRAGLSQVLWADAVFVRDVSRLAWWPTDQILRAAVVLHDVYFSADLVLRLLMEIDRRLGGVRAKRYVDAMSGVDLPMTMLTVSGL